MPLDLKIIDSSNGTLFPCTWPNPDFVDSTYSLVQKIYKNLRSIPGSDEFDPTWGCDLPGALFGIDGGDPNSAKKAAVACFVKCLRDLQDSPPDQPEQQLVSLSIVSMAYDVSTTSWNLQVQVETRAGSTTIALTA
jgi:hypothetical protein